MRSEDADVPQGEATPVCSEQAEGSQPQDAEAEVEATSLRSEHDAQHDGTPHNEVDANNGSAPGAGSSRTEPDVVDAEPQPQEGSATTEHAKPPQEDVTPRSEGSDCPLEAEATSAQGDATPRSEASDAKDGSPPGAGSLHSEPDVVDAEPQPQEGNTTTEHAKPVTPRSERSDSPPEAEATPAQGDATPRSDAKDGSPQGAGSSRTEPDVVDAEPQPQEGSATTEHAKPPQEDVTPRSERSDCPPEAEATSAQGDATPRSEASEPQEDTTQRATPPPLHDNTTPRSEDVEADVVVRSVSGGTNPPTPSHTATLNVDPDTANKSGVTWVQNSTPSDTTPTHTHRPDTRASEDPTAMVLPVDDLLNAEVGSKRASILSEDTDAVGELVVPVEDTEKKTDDHNEAEGDDRSVDTVPVSESPEEVKQDDDDADADEAVEEGGTWGGPVQPRPVVKDVAQSSEHMVEPQRPQTAPFDDPDLAGGIGTPLVAPIRPQMAFGSGEQPILDQDTPKPGTVKRKSL